MSKTFLKWQEGSHGDYLSDNDYFRYLVAPAWEDEGGGFYLIIYDIAREKSDHEWGFETLDAEQARAEEHYIVWLNATRSERLTDSRIPTAHAASHNTVGVDPRGRQGHEHA